MTEQPVSVNLASDHPRLSRGVFAVTTRGVFHILPLPRRTEFTGGVARYLFVAQMDIMEIDTVRLGLDSITIGRLSHAADAMPGMSLSDAGASRLHISQVITEGTPLRWGPNEYLSLSLGYVLAILDLDEERITESIL